MAAMEATIGTTHAMMLSAERTNHIVLIPTRLEDSPTALVFGIEVGSEFEYGVESAEVNHKSQVSG